MKIFFLLNPSDPQRLWDYREAAGQAARSLGAQVHFGEIDRGRPQVLEQLLTQAYEEQCHRLVLLGGDGTLHRTVNALRAQGRLDFFELAAVPAGTCNDFARAIGLRRRQLSEALRLACSGEPRACDLGRLAAGSSDILFLNNAGFGRRYQPPTGKRAKPLRTLRSFSPNGLRVRWDKGSMEGSFLMGMACNAPFFSGGFYFSKGVRANDGLLDVFLVPSMAKWRLFPLFLKGRLGRPVRSRRMISLRVPQLEIEAETDLWPQADGEPPTGPVRRVAFSIAREKVMIVFPKPTWLLLS